MVNEYEIETQRDRNNIIYMCKIISVEHWCEEEQALSCKPIAVLIFIGLCTGDPVGKWSIEYCITCTFFTGEFSLK